MSEVDLDKSALLEEVFNELGNTDKTELNVEKNEPSFFEDVLNWDKDLKTKNKKFQKCEKNDLALNDSRDSQKNNSIIHEGLTDSSDDEDNKYFEETKYNECGRTIKKFLKQNKVPVEYEIKETIPKNTRTSSEAIKEKLKAELNKLNGCNTTKGNLLVDPILGMRIINPLISSSTMKEKMIGRVSISTSKVKKFVESETSKEADWVTGGAIVSKVTRTSQKGNQYCIWNVTDLIGDIKTVCIFLFGSAYKEYWKTSLGTVVGILNPVVMDSRDKSEATLRVDNAQKILILGMSKDYGVCKSKKKNGENCTSVVNTAKCDYCTYHIKKEYTKACRRSDLQPPKIGRSLDNLKAKVLGKSEVFYGGKVFTAVGKKVSKLSVKDEERLKKLSQKAPAPVNQALINRDKDILSKLDGNTVPAKKCSQTAPLPQVVPSLSQNNLIDLNFTVTKKEKHAAKANAIKYIQQFGPIKKTPNSEKTKRTMEQILSVKRKLESEQKQENKKIKITEENSSGIDPIKKNLIKHGITEEFLKMMNSEAKNVDLVKVAENEEREKYFNKLETREKIEEKMASTFKVECKAVRCLKCNYKSFSASDFCKKEKHPLRVVNAIKRFWKCGDCGARTVCLELVPLHSCKTCGSSKWERSSMMPEKKGPNLTVEPLSLRGNEEKFIGAAIKNASLNLLVPEENS